MISFDILDRVFSDCEAPHGESLKHIFGKFLSTLARSQQKRRIMIEILMQLVNAVVFAPWCSFRKCSPTSFLTHTYVDEKTFHSFTQMMSDLTVKKERFRWRKKQNCLFHRVCKKKKKQRLSFVTTTVYEETCRNDEQTQKSFCSCIEIHFYLAKNAEGNL